MTQHVTAPVPAVSSLRPGLSVSLDAFFSKAMSEKPGFRFPRRERDAFRRSIEGAPAESAAPRPLPRVASRVDEARSRRATLVGHVGLPLRPGDRILASGGIPCERALAIPLDAGQTRGRDRDPLVRHQPSLLPSNDGPHLRTEVATIKEDRPALAHNRRCIRSEPPRRRRHGRYIEGHQPNERHN